MACLRCRSDWVTLKGKDMVSCPECCKQQRCKARRQGRLPAEESKQCERCGCEFIASGANAMARSRYCSACSDLARQEYLQARKDKIKSGEWKPKPQRKMKGRKCLRCGAQLNQNQSKYCGGECYNAAKKEGIQSWDRTRQLESIWHRGGRWACAPSRKPIAEMRHNMHAFLRKVSRLYARVSAPIRRCRQCGVESQQRICSPECKAAYDASRLLRRKQAKKQAASYRKKCRRYGGYYNAKVTRIKVFKRDSWRCHVCKKKCLRYWAHNHPLEATVDHHPIPLSKGGDHDWHNVRCAHRKCNSKKGNKWDGQRRLAFARP